MQGKFDKQIDEWIDAHRDAMVEDIKRLVRIPSVSDPTEETKPFGKECRRAMVIMEEQKELPMRMRPLIICDEKLMNLAEMRKSLNNSIDASYKIR